jgi:hypothetical protein
MVRDEAKQEVLVCAVRATSGSAFAGPAGTA